MKLFAATLTSAVAFSRFVSVQGEGDHCEGLGENLVTELSFETATMVSNTLHEIGGEMRFGQIGTVRNVDVDLRIVDTISSYHNIQDYWQQRQKSSSVNGKKGKFGQINIQNRGDTPNSGYAELRFCIVERGTNKEIAPDEFKFTVYDEDQRGDGQGDNKYGLHERMYFDTEQAHSFQLWPNLDESEIDLWCDHLDTADKSQLPYRNGCPPGQKTIFHSTTHGGYGDNPQDPASLTDEQKQRSVSITFQNRACFDMAFELYCPATEFPSRYPVGSSCKNDAIGGGNFLFSGAAPEMISTAECFYPELQGHYHLVGPNLKCPDGAMNGEMMKNTETTSLELCYARCYGLNHCNFFTWDVASNTCTGCMIDGDTDLVQGPGVTYEMIKMLTEEDFGYKIHNGVRGLGHKCPFEHEDRIIKHQMTTKQQCYEFCKAHSECRFFSWGEDEVENNDWEGNCMLCREGDEIESHTGFNFWEILPETCNVDEPASGNVGKVSMCLRTSLGYTSTGGNMEFKEVNFIESLIDIVYDMSSGFCVREFQVEPKDREGVTESEAYDVKAWLCTPDETELVEYDPDDSTKTRLLPKKITKYNVAGTESDVGSTAFNQGGLIEVCVAPDHDSYDGGVVMESLMDFTWKRNDSGPNVAGTLLEQSAIVNGQPSPNFLTSYNPASCNGSLFCHFSSVLFAQFYANSGEVYGSGNALMKFPGGASRRLTSEEEQDPVRRKLQDDPSSVFDLSLSVVGNEDNDWKLKTAGAALFGYGYGAILTFAALLSAII